MILLFDQIFFKKWNISRAKILKKKSKVISWNKRGQDIIKPNYLYHVSDKGKSHQTFFFKLGNQILVFKDIFMRKTPWLGFSRAEYVVTADSLLLAY